MGAKVIEHNDDLLRDTELEVPYLRKKRKPILEAYDKFKAAVAYGDLTATESERTQIARWYHKILDTSNPRGVLEAINDVPAKISYYL